MCFWPGRKAWVGRRAAPSPGRSMTATAISRGRVDALRGCRWTVWWPHSGDLTEVSQLFIRIGLGVIAAAFALSNCARAQTFVPSEVKVLGPIDYGQTSAAVRYSNPPRYRAYEFNARPGDHIEIQVHAKRGVPEAFVTDSSFKSLAGGSAKFSATIPPDSKPATYYIVFREAKYRPGEFTIELQRPSGSAQAATPNFLACSSDSECVAVERAGCCHNGYKDAVNRSRVAEYQAANACKDLHVMCAMFFVNDDRVP